MYCEWYGVSDFVVLSVVEVCADYGGVNVYHACLNFGVIYGVGVCVKVCGVVCVVRFLRLEVVCCVVMSGWVLCTIFSLNSEVYNGRNGAVIELPVVV